jgi:hypothetical protein
VATFGNRSHAGGCEHSQYIREAALARAAAAAALRHEDPFERFAEATRRIAASDEESAQDPPRSAIMPAEPGKAPWRLSKAPTP